MGAVQRAKLEFNFFKTLVEATVTRIQNDRKQVESQERCSS